MQAIWVLLVAALASISMAAPDSEGVHFGRSLSTVSLLPAQLKEASSYPNATLQAEQQADCVSYYAKQQKNKERCSKWCILTGFKDDTEKPYSPLVIRVAKGETSVVKLRATDEGYYLTPSRKTLPDDAENFKGVSRANSQAFWSRWTVAKDAKTGSRTTIIVGYIKRDGTLDTNAPKPVPSCILNITWVAVAANPDKAEKPEKPTKTKEDAKAPTADDTATDAFGGADKATKKAAAPAADDAKPAKKGAAEKADAPAPKASPKAAEPDGFRRRLLASGSPGIGLDA